MKIFIYTILIVLISACAFGQAKPGIYPWSVAVKVQDDTAQPISGAEVHIGYMQTNQIVGFTDSNGVFVASHVDKALALGFIVKKEGYYSDYLRYNLFMPGQFDDAKVAANRNATQTLVLRKIGNPVAMYAKRQEMKFPSENAPIGFDLSAGDWVGPYATGFHADIFFAVHRKIVSEREYDATLTVTFPNKGDGIVSARPEYVTGSAFKTSRVAVESGYLPELNLHYSTTERPKSVFGYFIRVKTALDEHGHVKSAQYGKIDGDFRFYAGTIAPTAGMGFDYYLNPTPNDRNVEFDPKQNLFKNLKYSEQVSAP